MKQAQKSILIVDDIELNRAILCELFHSRYQIIEAENGREAMELVEQRGSEIAVMLLDIVMPVMDGIEVLQEMRRAGWIEKIPVILITAESNEDTALKGYTMGVSDIINKPFNPDIVWRRVENIIDLYDHKHNLEKLVQEQLAVMEEQARKLKQTNNFVIDTLSTVVEFRNGESGSHIKRIRALTKTLLEALADRYEEYRFSQETIDTIASASAMHDIGKIAIPDKVLLKPGRLTMEEFETMKTHTIRGCEILQSLDYAQNEEYYHYCYEICRHHHERWDGKGYPDHLQGSQISIWAQVVSLADVYEALVSERVYKPAYTHEQAVEMIRRGECGVFNPQLLQCFLEVSDALRMQLAGVEEHSPEERPARTGLPLKPEEPLTERTLWLLELEREKYRVLSEMSGEIVFDYDARTDVMRFSEKYVEVFGGNFQIPHMTDVLHSSAKISRADKEIIRRKLTRLTPAQSGCKLEIQIQTASGQFEWFEVYVNAFWRSDAGAECVSIIGKLTNIHAAKMETKRLREQASTDPLTGLSNRKATEERVADYLRPDLMRSGAILFLDVDRFKVVNDTYGHQMGDETLQRIAGALRSLFRSTDVIGRIGGDEFVIFLGNVELPEAEKKADQVCQLFRTGISQEGKFCGVSGSIGISQYPQDGRTYSQLLSRADKALYHAKRAGKDQYAVYEPGMDHLKYQSMLSEVGK